jgi:hypothetical protein
MLHEKRHARALNFNCDVRERSGLESGPVRECRPLPYTWSMLSVVIGRSNAIWALSSSSWAWPRGEEEVGSPVPERRRKEGT